MIDSTKSPVPAWKRYLTMAVLAVLVVAAPFVLYTKVFKHSSSGSSPTAPVAAKAPSTTVAKAGTPVTTTTTIPGGIIPSDRNPFSPS